MHSMGRKNERSQEHPAKVSLASKVFNDPGKGDTL